MNFDIEIANTQKKLGSCLILIHIGYRTNFVDVCNCYENHNELHKKNLMNEYKMFTFFTWAFYR